MDIRTVRYSALDLDEPSAIIGFPSSGLVSSIAANYYVSQLKMPVIAGLSGPELPPYCFLSGGNAYPPIRMYGHKGKVRRGKKEKDVVICLSEYAPKPEQCFDVVQSLGEYLRSLGTKEVICIEGVPRMSPEDSIIACGSGPGSMEMVRKSKVPSMESGMIRGTSGVMMYEGPLYGFNVMSLIVPANQNIPDPGAAAGIIGPISRIIPGLKVDPDMLFKEAEEIDKHLSIRIPQEPDSNKMIYG
ncbi:MAG: proteasome assembly chaperone family protein [Candidatus Methanomethylophilaceae archaeon]|jgi:uncharacterized protein|nr:proteasome assembly chaperone family protein [Candidatus Methanomethylophilaceae archaeon]